MTWFAIALLAVGVLAGATATVVGFGIGSLLTPLLAVEVGIGPAVAAVVLPHVVATGLRFWRFRADVDVSVLRRFGLVSAAGGLAGALLYARLGSSVLALALGGLLLLTSVAGLTGWVTRWHPRGAGVWLLGLTSGFFGGIAGNQGGIRSGALLAFALTPRGLIATATATGLLVDLARMPIYFWRAGSELWTIPHLPQLICVATVGVVVGTVAGERILFNLNLERFRRVVAALVGVLGLWLIVRVYGVYL
jgi:uncharacterized membrane protein YfcA